MQDTSNSVTDLLAKSRPSVLFNALRNNGYFIYSVHKDDINEHLASRNETSQRMLAPVTDDDMRELNKRDSYSATVTDTISHEEIMTAIVTELNFIRHDKNEKRSN